MGFQLNAYFRRWAWSAALIHSIAAHGPAQLVCFSAPVFYLFVAPVTERLDDARRRVLFSSHIEVDIDGLWLLDDAAGHRDEPPGGETGAAHCDCTSRVLQNECEGV
jgi:hypothetical protein